MKYENLIFKDNDDMKKIIETFNLDISSLEVQVYFLPSNILYESTLMIELNDKDNSESIQIADYYLSELTENLGSVSIGRNFSQSFIDQINETIQERSAK